MTDFNNGITEGTDMGVEAFAYSPKLRSTDERWHYTKNEKNNNIDDVDEGFDTYISDKKNDLNQNVNQYQQQYEQTNNNTYQYQYQNQNQNENQKQNENQNENQQYETKPKLDTNKFIDEEYENLSSLEKRLRRLDIMRALGELRDLGCKVTNYSIDDDYYMMKYELDLHRSIRSKRNWLGLYSHMLIGAVKGVELLNNNYNPFDFSLSGLSDEVKADKNTYYEILGEIYEHHNVPGKKMNPWFRLFVTLIGVVVVVGGKNNAHKFIPNKAQFFENNQDNIEELRARAAKDSQSQVSKQKTNKNGQQNGQQNTQQNNSEDDNLDNYMNRQHEKASQRAQDLEELKRQELEYQRYQKMMNDEKNRFNDIKKGLEMTASPGSMSSSRANLQSVNKKLRPQTEIISEKDTISNMSTSTNNTKKSSQTLKSSVSQISINNNLIKKLNNKNKNSIDNITADQISFGSNKKK